MAEKEKEASKEGAQLEKKLPCQVTYFVGEQSCRGSSLHFSERGILVTCSEPAALNSKLKMVLQFPGFRNPIELQGEVVWTNIHGPSDSLSPRGMGVKFIALDREVERLLAELAGQYDCFGSIYGCYYT